MQLSFNEVPKVYNFIITLETVCSATYSFTLSNSIYPTLAMTKEKEGNGIEDGIQNRKMWQALGHMPSDVKCLVKICEACKNM